MYRLFLLTASIALFFSSCKDDEGTPPQRNPDVTFDISYAAGNQPLLMDTVKYFNQAGNNYSVNHLEYYLSAFSFLDDKDVWWTIDGEFYVNGRDLVDNCIELYGLPRGNYRKVKFLIGLPPARNKSGALPPLPENLNMFWPDMMGGGYHFLKLEGYFKDSAGQKRGYAMHIGRTENAAQVEIPCNFNHTGNDVLKLLMDVNEWFGNPHTYDFNVQGNYSMGVDSLMGKLKQNGADVFTIIP